MLRGNLTKRLEEIREELAREREAVRILDEQVAFQQDVADDAQTHAVVDESPLANRERREATGDLERLRRQHGEHRQRIAALTAEQDRLLEEMFEQAGDR